MKPLAAVGLVALTCASLAIGSNVGPVPVVASGEAEEGASARDGLIAYERYLEKGTSEIWLMRVDGTGQRRLIRGCCFDWSPDGRALAYVDDGVYVVSVDGSGQRRLADLPRSADYCGGDLLRRDRCELLGLDWSPDGRSVAFDDNRGITAARVDGSGDLRLTSGEDYLPRWSPSGRQIAFVGHRNEGDGIFVVNANGSGLRRLTRLGCCDVSLSWSPNGRKLAFETDGDLWVMNADGSGQTNVSHTPEGSDEDDPAWSPDGTTIVYEMHGSIRTLTPTAHHRHRNLTRRLGGGYERPQWSADGRDILVARFTMNQSDLWTMSSTGQELTRLTHTARPINERSAFWSPGK